jgi:hypothetical protein
MVATSQREASRQGWCSSTVGLLHWRKGFADMGDRGVAKDGCEKKRFGMLTPLEPSGAILRKGS